MDKQRRDLFKLGGLLGAAGLVHQARGAETAPSPAGSWMVQIAYDDTAENQGSRAARKTAMCQFFDDGRWVGSISAVNPDSVETWPANWRQATFHGEWKRTNGASADSTRDPRRHDDTAGTSVTIQASRLRVDDAGNFVGNSTTTITATLSADGQKWVGSFLTTSITLTGKGSFSGNVTGARM